MRKADNLPPFCAVVTKSGSFNFLEPSGPVQACNGTAFFFTLHGGVNTCNNINMKEMVCGYACVVITEALVRIFFVTFAIEFHIEIQILTNIF